MPIHGYPGNVITANPVAPTSTVATGVWTTEQQLQAVSQGNWPGYEYPISRSLRFNSADSAYLNRTPASASNRKTWTWSGWIKRTTVNTTGQNLFSTDNGSSTTIGQLFFNDAILEFNCYASSAYQWRLITTQVWRDLSAWYHIVAVVDTTQATSSNRVKLYVNGTQITAFSTATYPSQNFDGAYNLNQPHYVGAAITSSGYLNGYLTEVNFIDGQALTPSSFGLNDPETGVWSPKRYTGTYGTNGFYLKFLPSYSGGSFSADYLVVAGGAGGGFCNPEITTAGGGGAGGYRELTSQTLNVGTAYTVTVGAGGAGGVQGDNTARTGVSGANSVFGSITSSGGGGGGGQSIVGNSGGSGGGGGYNKAGGSGNTPSTSPSQGNNGGSAVGNGGPASGGGGGASAVGGSVGSGATTGGAGGAGTASSITGSSVTRAGGGGGGGNTTKGAGGAGGGGDGGQGGASAGSNGTANTGGGGGGGSTLNSGNANGGAGGSGVVIIKIPSQYSANFTSGVTYSISTAVSGFKIYTVTATSTTSETVTFV